MSREDEKLIVEKFLNLENDIIEAQNYIKENYHINSEYDADDDIIYIWCNNVNESLNLAAAKEYILENIGSTFVNVMFGMKQA